MAKVEFFVGPAVELTALKDYRDLLNTAYQNGENSGGSMDWNDVQRALDKAIDALGTEAFAFMEAAENGDFYDVDDDRSIKISFMPGTDVTNDVLSAAKLVFAYRYPESVKWEDVDEAWELLKQDKVLEPSA